MWCLLLVVSCGVWHEVVAVCVWCLLLVVSCGVWHEVVVMCVVLVASGLLWGLA